MAGRATLLAVSRVPFLTGRRLLPWRAPRCAASRGLLHVPLHTTRLSPDSSNEDPSEESMLTKIKSWLVRRLGPRENVESLDLTEPESGTADLSPRRPSGPGRLSNSVENRFPSLFETDNSIEGNHAKVTQLVAVLEKRTGPALDDVVVFNKIIHCYERLGMPYKCEEWMQRMLEEGIQPIRVTFNSLIKASKQNPERGEYWYGRMRQMGLEPNIQTFNKLIENYSEAGDLASALHWFQTAKEDPNIQLDEVIYNTVLKAYSGKPDGAEQWVASMVASGCNPSLYTFNKLIDIFAQTGLASKVVEKIEQMQQAGCRPDAFTYNSAIFVHQNNPDEAAFWYQRLHAAGVAPNEITFTWLIKSNVQARNYEAAERLLQQMTKAGLTMNEEFCRNLFYIYLRSGLPFEAEIWFERYLAQSRGLRANFEMCSDLISGFSLIGDSGAAKRWYQRILDSGSSPDVRSLNAVIDALCRSNKPEEARQFFDEIGRRNLEANVQSFNPFLLWASHQSNGVVAKEWFARLIAAGIAPDFWSYHWIVEAFCNQQNVEQALHWFEQMEAAGIRGNEFTYCALIKACRNNTARAEAIMQRMITAGIRPNTAIMNAIIDVYAQAGEPQRAEEYFDEALAAGLVPDGFTYGILINACATAPDRAVKWFNRMRKSGLEPNVVTFSSMIKAYATLATSAPPHEMIKHVAQAEEWFERMLEDGIAPSLHTFTTLISLYARVGRPDQAARTFLRLIDSGLQPNVFTYTALIGSFANAGQLQHATKVFERMVQHGVEPNEKTYLRLFRACLNADSPADVAKWLSDMDERGVRSSGSTRVVAVRIMHMLRQRHEYEAASSIEAFLQRHR